MVHLDDDSRKFKEQQRVLNFLIHACDLSTPTRKFDTLKKWTYLLFDEFFKQGDVEKLHEKPISFLCNRETVVVCKEQPGFLNFICNPIWTLVAEIIPEAECAHARV